MGLTLDEVRGVARLARLGLDEQAIAAYATQLSRILDLVDQLEAAETEHTSPMAHPLDLSARLRADVAHPTADRDRCQAVAPDIDKGLYRVPRVLG